MNDELDQLGERIAEQAAHLDAAMHRLLTDLREFDARGGWRAQGMMSCAHWLAWRVGWDLVTARDHMRVACKLAGFPAIDDALRRGEVSYSKVRALLRVATPANETLLLDHARLMTASQLEKLCRKYALVQRHGQDLHPQVDEQRRHVRRRDTEDGMVKIEAVLHPEEAEVVWTMLNHAAAQLAREPSPMRGDDAAESRGPGRSHEAPSASLPSAMPDSDLDTVARLAGELAGPPNTSRPTDDSAESRLATASLQRLGAADSDDSAESREATTPLQSLGAAESNDSAESREATTPLQRLGAADSDDSAESRRSRRSHVALRASLTPVMRDGGPGVVPCVTSSAAQPRNTSRPIDDSAESCEASAPLQNLGNGEFDASAESRRSRRSHVALRASLTAVMPDCDHDAVAFLASGSAQPPNTSRPIDDSAELYDVASRSLLDRLLDEADALGGMEAAVRDPLDMSSDPVDAPRRPRAGAGAGADTGAGVDAGIEAGVDTGAGAGVDAGIEAGADTGAGAGVDAQDRREVSALRERAAAARRAFNRADALVAVAQRYLRGDRPDRSPIEVVLTIPATSLRAASADPDPDPVEVGEMGESFLSGETARRLSCDAGMVEVIEDEHGAPLSVGRKRRTIAGALKRALRKRDGACTFPGCTNRIFLEGHHIQHWADGGETSLSNTALLCSLHHRHVHEYGYSIELGAGQRPQFRDPHGRLVTAVPGRSPVSDLGWPQIRATNVPLQIDADTIAGPWDGTPVDYGRIVGHLASADSRA